MEKVRSAMKKLVTKGIGLFLCVLILLGSLPLTATAEENLTTDLPAVLEVRPVKGEPETYDALLESVDELGGEALLTSNAMEFAVPSSSYSGGDMYSQLTARQKACYTALENISFAQILRGEQVSGGSTSYHRVALQDISGLIGTTMTGLWRNGSFTFSSAGAAVQKSVYTDLCAAIVALRYDRPDMLWLNRMMYGYRYSSTDSTTARITHVFFEFNLAYNGQENAMRDTMMTRARAIATQASAGSDTYNKVKLAHDILAAGSTYGVSEEPLAHQAYSALISGDNYEPVCDGYSKAMKIVCDLLDIPCVLVSSATHMWNNILMDDGKWYNLDLTWDDSGDVVRYDFFLIGSQTQIGGTAFALEKEHQELDPYLESYQNQSGGKLNLIHLNYPKKNTEAYEYLGKDYPQPTFPDVRRPAWYYDAVEEAASLGLFQGDEKGYFNPSRNITRAQFAQVMANALNVDLSNYGGDSFTDVKAGKWYSPAVAWAKEFGLVSGYTDGSFHPNSPISRQEMCVIISNTLRIKPEKTGYVFPDDRSIASWAKDAVYTCYALGLVKGDEKNNFNARGITLRSQAATVFTRYVALDSSYLPIAEPAA